MERYEIGDNTVYCGIVSVLSGSMVSEAFIGKIELRSRQCR